MRYTHFKLAINTSKGQESLRQEMKAIEIWHQHCPSLRYVKTPPNSPAIVDGFIIDKGVISAVVELKARDYSVTMLKECYKNRALLTAEKIMDAVEVAQALAVKFELFIYCIPDDTLLTLTLWSPRNKVGWMSYFCMMVSKTPSDCNKTKDVDRLNAYVDMAQAITYQRRERQDEGTTLASTPERRVRQGVDGDNRRGVDHIGVPDLAEGTGDEVQEDHG